MKGRDDLFLKLGLGLMLGRRAWFTPEKLGIRTNAYICAFSLVYSSVAFESIDAAMRAVLGLMCAALVLLTLALRHQRVSATLFCRAGFAGSFAFLPWAYALELAPTSVWLEVLALLYGIWVLLQAIFMDEHAGMEQHSLASSRPARLAITTDPASPTPAATGPSLGEFKGMPIHEWVALTDGRVFHFRRICQNPCALDDGEIVLRPGLVYRQEQAKACSSDTRSEQG